jgi:NAD(P)H dehydrogenase (quinone)
MKILIVYCHPSKQSYTYRILEQLQQEILRKNWTVAVSDLYDRNFQSDMTEEEYRREGFSNIEVAIPADVIVEHKKLEWADAAIFLYPVWWSDCPAKLKGWFDRVWSVGYAYKQSDNFPKMKTLKYGVALCVAGYTVEFLAETGMAQSMERIMVNDRLGNRFQNKEMVILGGTLELEQVKDQHSVEIRELLDRIQRRVTNDKYADEK